MQFTLEETVKPRVLKNSTISIPNSLYTSKIPAADIETEACCINDSANVFVEIWSKQHPLIHTWLVLSSISICFLSALFFIFS